MWSTQMQVDTWINLGGVNSKPDEWVRVSEIQRIRMVENAEFAVVILRSGEQIATGRTAQQIMKMITDFNKEK